MVSAAAFVSRIRPDVQMTSVITGEELREAVARQTFIKDGNPDSVEGIKYDFHLGTQLLFAGGSPLNIELLPELEKSKLQIAPGEVVFALTKEQLNLPVDIFAQLSPKRKISHSGVLTVGGFCIDPEYDGYLLLGLYNFSSTPFKLMPGKKVIGATFYRLEGLEKKLTGQRPTPLKEFPLDLVNTMEKYKPEGAAQLIQSLQNDLNNLRAEVIKHDRFEEILERHDNQIDKFLEALAEEKDARVSGDDKLTKAVEGMNRTLTRFEKIGSWLSLVATAILIAWFSKIFGLI